MRPQCCKERPHRSACARPTSPKLSPTARAARTALPTRSGPTASRLTQFPSTFSFLFSLAPTTNSVYKVDTNYLLTASYPTGPYTQAIRVLVCVLLVCRAAVCFRFRRSPSFPGAAVHILFLSRVPSRFLTSTLPFNLSSYIICPHFPLGRIHFLALIMFMFNLGIRQHTTHIPCFPASVMVASATETGDRLCLTPSLGQPTAVILS
jgi:hypothetical protein